MRGECRCRCFIKRATPFYQALMSASFFSGIFRGAIWGDERRTPSPASMFHIDQIWSTFPDFWAAEWGHHTMLVPCLIVFAVDPKTAR